MQIFSKLRTKGLRWLFQRILHELMQPTTKLGKKLRFLSWPVYFFICKPINAIYTLVIKLKPCAQNTFTFIYDLEVEPITYNFLWALSIADARRAAQGLKKLRVIFVPGFADGLRVEASDYEAVINHDARSWRIYSMLLPALMCLPTQPEFHFLGSREEVVQYLPKNRGHLYPDQYTLTTPTTHQMQDAFGLGDSVMPLRASKQSLVYVSEWIMQQASNRKVITITLRDYDYGVPRNSKMKEWGKFCDQLDHTEYFVVVVPDTDKAFLPLDDALSAYASFTPASWTLAFRAALYQLAYLNLGVNTGPMSLCWNNALSRYITFKMITKEPSAASLDTMVNQCGFTPGEAPDFANEFQQWVWEEDDAPVIIEAFEAMCDKIESTASAKLPQ